ncbi:MAG: hypothetical protein ACK5MP_08535 [Nostocoides sp.]
MAAALVFAASWLGYLGLLQWSVVRFRVTIVAGLSVSALLLAGWILRRWRVPLLGSGVVLVLLGSAAIALWVPLFSYLTGGARVDALGLVVVTALLLAAVLGGPWAARSWAAPVAAGIAATGYAALTAVAVLGDPAPRIDVWVTLQQAADGLARGENFYAMTWVDSPGIQDAFTYLPWTVVLLAPGRWLLGDVRWMLAVWMLVAFAGIWRLAGPRHRWAAAAAMAALAVAPGTLTQVDQAWTEPLLFAGLVWWAVLVAEGRAWWAIVPLSLVCASKQHLALVALLLMCWRPFGWRRTLIAGGLTAGLIAPWVIASPTDFVHDTVGLLVDFHPIRFANTWYLLAVNTLGVTPPFWASGAIVLVCLSLLGLLAWRRRPGVAGLLRVIALLLLVANLANKQAFYNQFWLSAALVAVSLAVGTGRSVGKRVTEPGSSTARPDLAVPAATARSARPG